MRRRADPGAEPALPAADQHAAVALVAGDGLGGAAVEHAEPPPADPADRQALQQRAALPGRAGPVSPPCGGHVRRQPGGVGQVGVPVDVAGMMPGDQDLPSSGRGTARRLAGRGPGCVDVALGAGAAVDVGAPVGGMGEDLVHRRVGGRDPASCPSRSDGGCRPLLAQPRASTCRADPAAANRSNTAPITPRTASSGCSRIYPGTRQQTRRQRIRSPPRAALFRSPPGHPGAQHLQLSLGHRTLQAQEEPVIEHAGMIDLDSSAIRVSVIPHQVQEPVPLGRGPGQPGDLQGQHDTDLPERDLLGQLGEPGPGPPAPTRSRPGRRR